MLVIPNAFSCCFRFSPMPFTSVSPETVSAGVASVVTSIFSSFTSGTAGAAGSIGAGSGPLILVLSAWVLQMFGMEWMVVFQQLFFLLVLVSVYSLGQRIEVQEQRLSQPTSSALTPLVL